MDPQELSDFLTARRGHLLAFIERQLGAVLRRKVEPEDIFQEASADAVRFLPTGDLSGRDPFSWLCQFAERRIIDAHRKFVAAQKRSAHREVLLGLAGGDASRVALIDQLAASMTTASEAFSRGERAAQLAAALATLPDDMRKALELRYLQGLPSKEIAQALGKSDGAVRVLLSRSLARLHAVLEDGKQEDKR